MSPQLRAGLTLALALGVTLLLAALARLVFDRSPGPRRRGPGGYGLLVSVACAAGEGEAVQVKALLARAGVRATLAPDPGPVRVSADGWVAARGTNVLVFPDDVALARRVLSNRRC